MDTIDSSPSRPEVAAGDPFAYAGAVEPHQERTCFFCLSGWVFLGSLDYDGGEIVESVKCRKCNGTGKLHHGIPE